MKIAYRNKMKDRCSIICENIHNLIDKIWFEISFTGLHQNIFVYLIIYAYP